MYPKASKRPEAILEISIEVLRLAIGLQKEGLTKILLKRLDENKYLQVTKYLCKRGFIILDNVSLQKYIFNSPDLKEDQRKEYLQDLLRKNPIPITLQAIDAGRIRFK